MPAGDKRREEAIMAKFESEGYCPAVWVPMLWDEETDPRLAGLWSIVAPSLVYEKEDEHGCTPDTASIDKMFADDPIAYDVLATIVKRDASADKILIRQLHNGACNTQCVSDIQMVMGNAVNPQLIVHAGSNFATVLADAEYGLDLWVWDLASAW